VARPERFELPTLCFEGRCSIQLSYGRSSLLYLKSWRMVQLLMKASKGAGMPIFCPYRLWNPFW
jgi:hypothetical protein